MTARQLEPGMGQAVAERTILRKYGNKLETWADVAERVAYGNVLLDKRSTFNQEEEFLELREHIASGRTLMSGRHLQHGDEDQPYRNQEVYTNCSTAAASFIMFYLLLNGSGVGRCYDDDMMVVDWNYAPNLRCVLSDTHPDFNYSAHESLRDARHKYGTGHDVLWHTIEDSREGWAKALEIYEQAAFEKVHMNKLLILDFSLVRPRGAPIAGMQGRPASGPVPLMEAFQKAASVKGAGLEPWRATMYIDHYFAECVLVGGARRSARMSTKHWSDKSILGFITIKRPIEYDGLTAEQILEHRAGGFGPLGFLMSSNNSVTVDEEFWVLVNEAKTLVAQLQPLNDQQQHAWNVFNLIVEASYADGTGEPGLINVHKLVQKDDGWSGLNRGDYVESEKYKIEDNTQILLSKLAKRAKKKKYHTIVNPCVTGDTLVMTSEGPRKVTDLINRPFTAIVDGKPYNSTGFWCTGVKQVFKVQTNRGYTISATGNHQVYVQQGRRHKAGGGYHYDYQWKQIDELEIGDKLVISRHRDQIIHHSNYLDDLGWILGLIKGDGGHNSNYRGGTYVRLFHNERIMGEDVALAIRNLSSSTKFLGGRHNTKNLNDTFTTSDLGGLVSPFLTEKDKKVTLELETGPAALVLGFLRGFFDADGSVQGSVDNGRSVRLSQSSYNDLQTVQRMLARFGIASSIYLIHKAGEKMMPDGNGSNSPYYCQNNWDLVISQDNLEQFRRYIGFSCPEKASKLDSLLNGSKRKLNEDDFAAEVISIEPIGYREVYDCSVEGANRFDANGLVVHNCGEIPLNVLGGFCVIADVVPYFSDTLEQAEQTFRAVTRALIRVNLMPSIYKIEVNRTNRIGVGITGIHEFAWKFFRVGFKNLINPDIAEARALGIGDARESIDPKVRAGAFWLALEMFNNAVRDESIKYSQALGVKIPHTCTTIKPAGTTSKLFGLTEGWHLPSMREYLRWVMFRVSDPLVKKSEDEGYPVRILKTYKDTAIVGYPTAPLITTLGMGDQLVTAGEATPEEQFRWVQLGEKYWIHGGDHSENYGGQISYTLKYNPALVSLEQFKECILEWQPQVRCCSVMPQIDLTSYEYQPEQPITRQEYLDLVAQIKSEDAKEDVDFAHIDCGTGACPIDFKK